MKNIKRCLSMSVVVVSVLAFATPTVTDVVAKQRYRWNGLVDITCKVSGIDETTKGFEFFASAIVSDLGITNRLSHLWIMKDGEKSTDRVVNANGNYRLLWDAKADLGEVHYTNMVVRVTVDNKVQLWEGGPYWATTNIGAEKPEDCGYYFWWGDTVGYKRENDKWVASDGSNSNFSFEEGNTPTYNKDASTLQSEGWITEDGVLASEHDAAQAHWGNDWRMPTKQELDGLINNCTWVWTITNGVKGYIVCGKDEYAAMSIFLPCSGRGYGNTLNYSGSSGTYWSSVYHSTGNSIYSRELLFNSSEHRMNYYYRCYGFSVRPVHDAVKCTVTFDVCGGSSVNPILVRVGQPVGELPTPTREGYNFLGWFTAFEGGDAITSTTIITANMTIYARWERCKVQLWENGPYWATTNIGAERPEDYGYYFWWGDTVGYKRENDKWVASDGSNSNFSFEEDNAPTYGKGISTLQSEGWITAEGVLAPEHDAAKKHWGGDWRMPTKQEFDDLHNKCDWTWGSMNGVNGYVVRGKGDYASNSIFLPCAGWGDGTSLSYAGSYGNYWSSVPYSAYNFKGSWDFSFYSGGHHTNYDYRGYGKSVRPLQGFTK